MTKEIFKYDETYLQCDDIRYRIYENGDELTSIDCQAYDPDLKQWITIETISFMTKFAEQIGQVLIDKFKMV